jgi:uncharacterized protein
MPENKNSAMSGYSFFAPLRYGGDMLEEIARVASEAGLRHAAISVIGAVSCASFGFYDQGAKKYERITRQGCYEVINCTGNITLKDGSPFVHAHVLFGEANGAAFGGHLTAPTTVFAAELHITQLAGPPPERLFDEKTGLHLWDEGRNGAK